MHMVHAKSMRLHRFIQAGGVTALPGAWHAAQAPVTPQKEFWLVDPYSSRERVLQKCAVPAPRDGAVAHIGLTNDMSLAALKDPFKLSSFIGDATADLRSPKKPLTTSHLRQEESGRASHQQKCKSLPPIGPAGAKLSSQV